MLKINTIKIIQREKVADLRPTRAKVQPLIQISWLLASQLLANKEMPAKDMEVKEPMAMEVQLKILIGNCSIKPQVVRTQLAQHLVKLRILPLLKVRHQRQAPSQVLPRTHLQAPLLHLQATRKCRLWTGSNKCRIFSNRHGLVFIQSTLVDLVHAPFATKRGIL